jgi:hypothetical protein
MPAFLTTTTVQAVAFVLFLVSLPLISFGATDDATGLWWTGLALLVIAGLLPPLARFVPLADDDEDDDGGAEASETDDEKETSG